MSRDDSPLRGRMVFLVGARRSGTNWLQRVLAAHPDVVAIPSETYVLSHGLRPFSERVQHGAVGLGRTGAVYMDRQEFLDASRDYCDRLFSGLEPAGLTARRILERTPWHVYCVDLIADVYPDAWVLHIIRDGRDVARSLLSQPWGPETMREAAEEWRGSVEGGRSQPRPDRYREVRYENLLSDPAATMPDLIEWLGLDADRGTVEKMLAEAGVEFNVDPSERGVRTGKWKALAPDQLAEFEGVAGALNTELGYADDGAPEDAFPAAAAQGRPDRAGPIRRARRRLRAARSSGTGGGKTFEREAVDRLEAAQVVFERVLEAIHIDPGRLEELLAPQADVRIVNRGSDWSGRGPDAARRLIAALREDPLRAGHQVRGDVQSGLPTFTAVLAYELPDGSRAERVVSARIRDERISGIYVYSTAG